MEEKQLSLRAHGLLWFGAAVSLAEIMTGLLFAPLGWAQGLTAIVLGHGIGCALLFAAGLVGARCRKSAMESTALAFGQQGSRFFALLNVVQLVGWTAVMIAGGAVCANSLIALGGTVWSVILGALIALWVVAGIKNVSLLNRITMIGLFALTVFASLMLFGGDHTGGSVASGEISFGAALELSIAMPLSWLPLIGDYTRRAQRPVAASLVSAAVYGITSCWMYAIGLGLALYAGGQDIAVFLGGLGFGWLALLIVLFSTVTTTFLDAYSAGISARTLFPVNEKTAALAVCFAGTVLAVFVATGSYESFLYFIGSAFAPMITILIIDFFVFGADASHKSLHWSNAVLWVVGVCIYRYFLTIETPLGNTLPVVLIVSLLCLAVGMVRRKVAASC